MADEFSEKLNAVLSNPDAMGQIMSIARSLTGDGGGGTEPTQDSESLAPAVQQASPPPDLSGLLSMLGGLTGNGGGGGDLLSNLDPRILQAGMRILSEYGHEDDRKTALLMALKPFLKEERAAKMDRAVQIAKLSRIVKVALQMFREGGESSNV
ncbi:MAG: hypothetical protein EOM52_11210 [Clostridia bacterium]|nr:hypothetical protein [Clostridia bacterium]